MTDPIRRAIRGWFQTFLGSIITSGVLSTFEAEGVVDWAVLKKALISAAVAGVVAVVTLIQNVLEDHTTMPALLKAPPSPGVNPVPDESGQAVIWWVIVGALAAVVLLALFNRIDL